MDIFQEQIIEQYNFMFMFKQNEFLLGRESLANNRRKIN